MKKINLNKPKRKLKWIFIVLLILFLFVMGYILIVKVNSFFDGHYIQSNKVIDLELKWPLEIKEREVETKELVKIIESIPAPDDLETDPEKLIYKYFGIEHYRMAIAVSKCEGLDHPADGFNVNKNGSIDVGYMRINSINFKIPSCSLLEVATPEGNIACGYKLWDRGDGEEENGRGNFNAWVGYTNGCALTKYQYE